MIPLIVGIAPSKTLKVDIPISVTCGYFNGYMIIDPTHQESNLLHGIMSTTFDSNNNILWTAVRTMKIPCNTGFFDPQNSSILINTAKRLRSKV